MLREIGCEDLEEGEEPGRDVFRLSEVSLEAEIGFEPTEAARTAQWVLEWAGAGSSADAEEASGEGVDLGRVELVEVAEGVDEDGALEGLLGEVVVADGVVGEVVEDFEGEDVAGVGDGDVPVEDGFVDDFDVGGVAAGGGVLGGLRGLERGERGGDFDYFVACAKVDFGVVVADVVEDIEH